jgi:centromeric protein E
MFGCVDNVFNEDDNTQHIYQKTIRPITKSVLDGYNGTIFMYGQTTSGKTYTMLGCPEAPGVLPCALRDIFHFINASNAQNSENSFRIWISYLEIYNEVINDLLVSGNANLKIKEDATDGVAVQGLKKQEVWSFDQAIILMNYGEQHRSYKETTLHEHSSRSHTIFKIYIQNQGPTAQQSKETGMCVRYSCLNLVDLAGSERLNEFDLKVDTLGETAHINKSLFVLANVINKLAEGKG